MWFWFWLLERYWTGGVFFLCQEELREETLFGFFAKSAGWRSSCGGSKIVCLIVSLY